MDCIRGWDKKTGRLKTQKVKQVRRFLSTDQNHVFRFDPEPLITLLTQYCYIFYFKTELRKIKYDE